MRQVRLSVALLLLGPLLGIWGAGAANASRGWLPIGSSRDRPFDALTPTPEAVPSPGATAGPASTPTRAPPAEWTTIHVPIVADGWPLRKSWPSRIAMARNIVLFIGDGMGQGPITAASYYSYGKPDWLTFERFPVRGRMSVLEAYGDVPESASSGTAMATCHKVERGVVSMAIPGDGRELTTVLELLQASGKWAGLVTSSLMTDASPASFGAHETSRDHHAAIAGDYLYQTRPRLLLGGGGPGFGPAEARAAGYTVVEDRQSMLELDPAGVDRLAGAFGSGLLPFRDETHASTPTLPEMTRSAIRFLERSEDGFFLLVEEERIDSYAHANDTARTVQAVLELVAAVRVARDWARDANDSLIIVTADHDTGGLEVVAGKGAGKLPEVRWSSQQHTCEPVPVFATGPDSEWIGATLDNTDLAGIMAPPIVTDDCG